MEMGFAVACLARCGRSRQNVLLTGAIADP